MSIIAADGFGLLLFATMMAGFVRGFSGFGAAMVYLPMASQVLSPFETLTTLIVFDVMGPMVLVPRAMREGHPKDVLRLGVGMVVFLPLGVLTLSLIPAEAFRYGISAICIGLLIMLVGGIRYRGLLSRKMIYATGGISGFLGGSVGLPGPPVIFLYMSSPNPIEVIRANTLLFLLLSDFVMIAVLQLSGHLVPSALWIGLILVVPNMVASMLGAWIFRPGFGRIYRAVAYLIILASALSGLPLFD